jgi:hypothetical protein
MFRTDTPEAAPMLHTTPTAEVQAVIDGQLGYAMNAKQLAAHVRGRLKHYGIKAKCSITPGGHDSIRISVPTLDVRFTDAEQRQIKIIGQVCNLTRVYGTPIDLERMTDPWELVLHLPVR